MEKNSVIAKRSERAGSEDAQPSAERSEYYQRAAREHLTPLWEFFKDWFTATPRVRSAPHVWRYRALRSLILESADLIDPEEAERRVLVLENPGLEGKRLITESLYAGLQLIMPGEVAPCHRHSPAALRFILEGHGAFTSVNGEKAYMESGDFIVTPSWTWHEHGHEGEGPTVWLDVLDVAVIHVFNATFTEHFPGKSYPRSPPPGDSSYRFGMNMLPVGFKRQNEASPIFKYPYSRSREVLEKLKRYGEPDPSHGLKMTYIDPTTGGPAIPTISTAIQLVPAGFETRSYRTTAGTVFCVVEGRGEVVIGAGEGQRRFSYEPWDILVVPSWEPFVIRASSESVLFSASDEAMQRKLGFWREQRSEE
jgi:gentisate 1,2-dioxygenase